MVAINKEHPDMPDSFKINITYHDNREEELECVEVRIIERVVQYKPESQTGRIIPFTWEPHAAPYLEIWTTDNLCKTRQLNSIKGVDYDKDYSKIAKINREIMQKNIKDQKSKGK